MESMLTRNEKIFIITGVSIIAAFLVTFHNINKKPRNVSQFDSAEVINYQMARPEEAYSGYSLDGREIDSMYEGLPGSNKSKNKPTKAADLKNQKLAPAKKQAIAVAKPTAIPTTVKLPTMTSKSKSEANAQTANKSNEVNPIEPSVQNTSITSQNESSPADDIENPKPERKGKSFSQWRAEIFAKPTKETMVLFISAFRKNEVTMTEFQAMAQDLMDQDDVNLKGLGLMALRSAPSLASLSQLVHVQEQMPATLQAYIEQAYLAYLQPQYVGIFNQVFQSKDKKLVVKSLSFLNLNLQKIRNGDVSGFIDPRQRRDADTPVLSLASFRTLLPALIQMGSSNIADVSPLAIQIASIIQNQYVAGL